MSIAIEKPAQIKYKIEKTATGVWRSHKFLEGGEFKEFISNREIFGIPFIHIVRGQNPETKKAAVARGVIGIGQFAKGFLAIGQFANGYLSIGQFSVGRIASIGQFSIAPISLGQFSVGVLAIGQLVFGGIGIATDGFFAIDGVGLAGEMIKLMM